MSIEASSFVLGLSMGRGNGIRKLILLGYANHADKYGRGAYPSAQTIADYAECDVRTVQRHVGWLIANGYLAEGDQQMVDHLDPRYRPIVYDVAMSTEQVEQWAAGAGPSARNRARSADAGRRGGQVSSQLSRGDNLSPLETAPRGDNGSGSGVTNHASRGDTGVTRTVQEPSQELSSSSSPAPERAPAPTETAGGGQAADSVAEAIDVLPEAVRQHPSVVPSALVRRVQALHARGWSQAEIRRRLAGVDTADKPGAAALTRLDTLARLIAPAPKPSRPLWCGHCDQSTRMRENSDLDGRPYRCPACHPRCDPASASRLAYRADVR